MERVARCVKSFVCRRSLARSRSGTRSCCSRCHGKVAELIPARADEDFASVGRGASIGNTSFLPSSSIFALPRWSQGAAFYSRCEVGEKREAINRVPFPEQSVVPLASSNCKRYSSCSTRRFSLRRSKSVLPLLCGANIPTERGVGKSGAQRSSQTPAYPPRYRGLTRLAGHLDKHLRTAFFKNRANDCALFPADSRQMDV